MVIAVVVIVVIVVVVVVIVVVVAAAIVVVKVSLIPSCSTQNFRKCTFRSHSHTHLNAGKLGQGTGKPCDFNKDGV